MIESPEKVQPSWYEVHVQRNGEWFHEGSTWESLEKAKYKAGRFAENCGAAPRKIVAVWNRSEDVAEIPE